MSRQRDDHARASRHTRRLHATAATVLLSSLVAAVLSTVTGGDPASENTADSTSVSVAGGAPDGSGVPTPDVDGTTGGEGDSEGDGEGEGDGAAAGAGSLPDESTAGSTDGSRGTDDQPTEDPVLDEEVTEDGAPAGQLSEGRAPEGRAPEGRAPEGRAPEGRAPEGRAPEGRAPGGKGAGSQVAEARGSRGKASQGRATDQQAAQEQEAERQSAEDEPAGDRTVEEQDETSTGPTTQDDTNQDDVAADTPLDGPSHSSAGSAATTTSGGRLTWTPPRLNSPITVHVSNSNNNLRLRDDRDYVIDMPDGSLRAAGGLTISGGNDVVLIGGEIQAPLRDGTARGLYLKNQTGTVHVEGLRLSGDQATEGINLDQRKGATVQLQNIAVGTVKGSYSGNHADVLQTWGGPEVLRIDRLDGSTTYQGFFLDPTKFHDDVPKHFDLRNIVLRDSGRTSAYLMWQSGTFPITTQNVTVVRNPSKPFPKQVLRSRADSWQDVSNGSSKTPSPLVGKPGLDYSSPGYRG